MSEGSEGSGVEERGLTVRPTMDIVSGPSGKLPSDQREEDRRVASGELVIGEYVDNPPLDRPVSGKSTTDEEPEETSSGPEENIAMADIPDGGNNEWGGGGPEEPPEPEEENRPLTWKKIQSELDLPGLTHERQAELYRERDKILEEVEDFDPRLISSLRHRLTDEAQHSDWDQVYGKLITIGSNFENELRMSEGHNPRWAGAVADVVDAWASRAILRGLDEKLSQGRLNDDEYREWLEEKNYRNRDLTRMASLSQKMLFDEAGNINMPLGLPRRPENLVGTKKDRTVELAEQSAMLQEASLGIQERQFLLMKRGYNGFIQGERVRSHVNPEQYDQALPPWFEELNDQEQDLLRSRLVVNYLAATKRDRGMSSLDVFIPEGFGLERDSLDYAMKNMPGFRIALKTMMRDIFELGSVNFTNKDGVTKEIKYLVISGAPEVKNPDTGEKLAATGGYAIVSSEKKLKDYKEKNINILERHLMQDPQLVNRAKEMQVTVRDFAVAAFSFSDNLLFMGGCYDSGDELRKITPGDRNVYSEAVRTFMMPGIKGKNSKWLTERGTKNPGVSEEDFGGAIGNYIRENAAVNRNGFRDKLRDGDIRLIPDRLFFSLLDQEYFSADAVAPTARGGIDKAWYAGMNISEALVSGREVPLGGGLYDFADGANAINFEDLGVYELLGDYGDTKSGGGVRIFKHITSDKPEDRLDKNGLINALIKARKDPTLNEIFRDEELVTAGIINSLAGKLVSGTSEIVLDIDERIYDSSINDFLNDTRLYEGMRPGFRERVLKRLHAVDSRSVEYSVRNALPGFAGSPIFNERQRIRKQASENVRHGR